MITRQQITLILSSSLPEHKLRTFEPLTGGVRNLNYLLHLEGVEDRLVLRIYMRDSAACQKEAELHSLVLGWIPAPEIICAAPHGEGDIGPYILKRYVEGLTFQELKSKEDHQETAKASYAIGAALAQLQRASSSSQLSPIYTVARAGISEALEEQLNTSCVEQRLGKEVRSQLRGFLTGWDSSIRALDRDRLLAHGDFSARNTVVRRNDGHWVVTGVLDWELACIGPRLWDAARFICFEPKDRSVREPHFSRGFAENGGTLPENWPELSRVINAISAIESLSRPDLPAAFVPELKDLIVATMTGRDA